jgi:hypothetical protein
MSRPIIQDDFILRKDEQKKGAWTFIKLPTIDNLPRKRNGTVKIRGLIDNYELKDTHMWAMKDGNFIAVKAEIRKHIGKEAGDMVRVVLYLDEPGMVIPEDFLLCLQEEPKLFAYFGKCAEKDKQATIDWIFAAKTEDEKITRMAKTMEKLEIELGTSGKAKP